MQEQFGREKSRVRRSEFTPLDLEADWSYLRANLDHPARRIGNRLGSGLAEWLLRRLDSASAPAPQLCVLARIALGPRQSLALVEAEGVHVLVGTAADGPPSFFPLATGSGQDLEHRADHAQNRDWHRDLDRDWRQEAASFEGASERVPNSRAVAGLPRPGMWGASAAGRSANRPRLTGRVSWV